MARSSKTTASKSRGGVKARGRPAAKKTAILRKKKTATSRKSASDRKRRPAKSTASKSRASVGGGKARGRTVANSASRATKTASKRAKASRKRSTTKSASRATKTASKRAKVSRKRSTTKSVSNRSGAPRTPRAENATPGAAITNPVTEAMALGTEVVSGAIQAGGEIVAATADMANSAARTAAAVTTGVVPDGSRESDSERDRGGRGKGS
jgi:hypothetical protein